MGRDRVLMSIVLVALVSVDRAASADNLPVGQYDLYFHEVFNFAGLNILRRTDLVSVVIQRSGVRETNFGRLIF